MNRYSATSWDKPVSPDIDTTETMEGLSKATGPLKAKYADKATEARYYAWLRSLTPPSSISKREWDRLLAGDPEDMMVQFLMFEKFLKIDPNPTFIED